MLASKSKRQDSKSVVLLVIVLMGLWWWPDESTSKFTESESYLELSSSDIVTVKTARLAHDVSVTGSITPVRQTILNARVAGEVKQVNAREGQSVNAGQVLVLQEDRDLVARVQQAEASLFTAKAELALAQQNLDRIKPLQQQNYVSANDIATAERQLDIRQAQAKSAQVSFVQAKQQLADMAVRAPFAGVVSERLVDVGQSVAPNTPLLKLVDLSQVELVAQVAATEVSEIRVGQVVYFSADGFDGQTFAGRITRINPVAKAGSRRVDVYALVNNQKGLLRGGLFAKGYVRDDNAQQGVAVPFSSLQEKQGKHQVHVVRDNRLVVQAVRVGRRDENTSMALVTGLKEGERVLLLPPLPNTEGRVVRMKEVR